MPGAARHTGIALEPGGCGAFRCRVPVDGKQQVRRERIGRSGAFCWLCRGVIAFAGLERDKIGVGLQPPAQCFGGSCRHLLFRYDPLRAGVRAAVPGIDRNAIRRRAEGRTEIIIVYSGCSLPDRKGCIPQIKAETDPDETEAENDRVTK